MHLSLLSLSGEALNDEAMTRIAQKQKHSGGAAPKSVIDKEKFSSFFFHSFIALALSLSLQGNFWRHKFLAYFPLLYSSLSHSSFFSPFYHMTATETERGRGRGSGGNKRE